MRPAGFRGEHESLTPLPALFGGVMPDVVTKSAARINADLPKILAPSLRELPAKRGEGELTFGSPAAFAAGSVWRAFRAIQSNTPSVSRQKRAADTSDVTTSRIARNQRFRLPGRLREGGYKDKS